MLNMRRDRDSAWDFLFWVLSAAFYGSGKGCNKDESNEFCNDTVLNKKTF